MYCPSFCSPYASIMNTCPPPPCPSPCGISKLADFVHYGGRDGANSDCCPPPKPCCPPPRPTCPPVTKRCPPLPPCAPTCITPQNNCKDLPAQRLRNVDVLEELCYYVPGCDPNGAMDCYTVDCCGNVEKLSEDPCNPCECPPQPVKYSRRQRFTFNDPGGNRPAHGDPWPFTDNCGGGEGQYGGGGGCGGQGQRGGGNNPNNRRGSMNNGGNGSRGNGTYNENPCCNGRKYTYCPEDTIDCSQMFPPESGVYYFDHDRKAFVPEKDLPQPPQIIEKQVRVPDVEEYELLEEESEVGGGGSSNNKQTIQPVVQPIIMPSNGPCPPQTCAPPCYPPPPCNPCGPPPCYPSPYNPCGPPPCYPPPYNPCGPPPCYPPPCNPCYPPPCNPCNPCASPCNPCNPCAPPCNPCNSCGPPCNPCNPCCMPCNPMMNMCGGVLPMVIPMCPQQAGPGPMMPPPPPFPFPPPFMMGGKKKKKKKKSRSSKRRSDGRNGSRRRSSEPADDDVEDEPEFDEGDVQNEAPGYGQGINGGNYGAGQNGGNYGAGQNGGNYGAGQNGGNYGAGQNGGNYGEDGGQGQYRGSYDAGQNGGNYGEDGGQGQYRGSYDAGQNGGNYGEDGGPGQYRGSYGAGGGGPGGGYQKSTQQTDDGAIVTTIDFPPGEAEDVAVLATNRKNPKEPNIDVVAEIQGGKAGPAPPGQRVNPDAQYNTKGGATVKTYKLPEGKDGYISAKNY